MRIGILRETHPGERRVALTPDDVSRLARNEVAVVVEAGAGAGAGFPDQSYADKGAEVVEGADAVVQGADALICVRLPSSTAEPESAIERLGGERILIGLGDPLGAARWIDKLAASGTTAFALELLPRITKAQSMDVLSSQAMVAGYKAVLLAADRLPRLFSMEMTAAGTLRPAQVFVVGAGVAGLKAIATAKRLGAVVNAYDVRPEVKEQVESVGGRFVELELETESSGDEGGYAKELGEEFYRKQRELMAEVVAKSNVVVTTAAIPGKKAPVLITEEMLRSMPPASVTIDLAAERGGNCEGTKPDEEVRVGDSILLGPTNLPSEMAFHASQMYSRNVVAFLENLVDDSGQPQLDVDDPIVRETMVCRDGRVVNDRVREALGASGKNEEE
jgi:NAD(P) transhydrogenase subunit alpha